jgi:hypothetical protein
LAPDSYLKDFRISVFLPPSPHLSLSMLGMEPRASPMLGNSSVPELHLRPLAFLVAQNLWKWIFLAFWRGGKVAGLESLYLICSLKAIF